MAPLANQSEPSIKLPSLLRRYTQSLFPRPKIHALNTSPPNTTKTTISSILFSPTDAISVLPFGLPTADLAEPNILPCFTPLRFVETLADVYRRFGGCAGRERLDVCVEQYCVMQGVGDSKVLRRCQVAARQCAGDVHSKVVLAAWLRYDRREDELVGVTSHLDCGGRILECPKAALENGYNSYSVLNRCQCRFSQSKQENLGISDGNGECSISEQDWDFCFIIGDVEINCNRDRIAALSIPLKAMLYGTFVESQRKKIDFSQAGISVEGMKAVEVFSRTRKLDSFYPNLVLELLHFANRFCCEEIKSSCDEYLASMVSNMDEALILIDYGLEEMAHLLVASCLQVFLRELPISLNNPKVRKVFCGFEARERLAAVGHSSFLLYYFLSQVSSESNTTSDTTLMLLERLRECATERWQKALAFHQLGCAFYYRNDYKNAQFYFEAASELGHVYSIVGIARTKYKQGQRFSAYKLMNNLISEHKPVGWMYQEQSLYNLGTKKISDLEKATELDPTLSFPYKYRAIMKMEENQIGEAISEINKIIIFKVTPDCLELRAWFYIAMEDYESAMRDMRALLTLEPDYMVFDGKTRGDVFVELLNRHVKRRGLGDCWMQLYDRWSCVDDIGSLAVVHQMLANDPGKSLILFRQSLLLLRLNCQKAAIRSLRLAQNHASSEYERLIYEGWVLYDTGYREEALSKADLSISIHRSFEAFFLKAYVLADANLNSESASQVIQLLQEALRCPSDGLRKGQALNNLGSIYVDSGKLDLALDCYTSALNIKHTRAHQGLARVYYLKNQRKDAYDEMTKLIEKAKSNASAYEKRSEYCDRDLANSDLSTASQLDPMRTYPYRYKAAVLMDDQRENEAVEELTRAIAFKADLQMLHLRAAFYESMGDLASARQDCEAALCLDPNHKETLDLYNRTQGRTS